MANELKPAQNGRDDSAELLAKLVLEGDLSGLNPQQKVAHYRAICERIGLDPASQPFAYLTLSGKMVLYAKKGATDQLRQIHGISIEIVDRRLEADVYIVVAKATTKDGRTDTDEGAVSMIYPDDVFDSRVRQRVPHPKAGQPLTGDDRANAILKAISKAKRRVTLSVCGLGMLDESEVETIPADRVEPVKVTRVEQARPEPKPEALPQKEREPGDDGDDPITPDEVRAFLDDLHILELDWSSLCKSERLAQIIGRNWPKGDVHVTAMTRIEFEKLRAVMADKVNEKRERAQKRKAKKEAGDEVATPSA